MNIAPPTHRAIIYRSAIRASGRRCRAGPAVGLGSTRTREAAMGSMPHSSEMQAQRPRCLGSSLYYTILYYTILCYTILYYTIIYNNVLYYTIIL